MFKLLLIFALTACSNAPLNGGKERKSQGKFYKDIDIFKLHGIEQIDSIQYPCIEILDSIDKKEIRIHADINVNLSRIYKLKGSVWISEYRFREDTGMVYSFQIISNDSVVTFNYGDSNYNNLSEVVLETGSKEIAYLPIIGFDVKPANVYLDYIAKNSSYIYTSEITRYDSLDIETITREYRDVDKRDVTRNCYEPSTRSYFWFRNFKYHHLVNSKCF